jgi:formate dehydrogenase beta subunit
VGVSGAHSGSRYIREIAAGDYDSAYMINWKSNVFPGILGRTCDRPCDPACRRGRLEEQPVAICRLKRVAADHKHDISALLPGAPIKRNGKRAACVGAGPASLTVARDLAAVGYEVVVFDSDMRAAGMMRSQIPKFRLPDEVIDEDVGYALSTGGQFIAERRIDSLNGLMGEGYDAIFVGCGAPRGRNLDIPGVTSRQAASISGLSSSNVSLAMFRRLASASSCWVAATRQWTAAGLRAISAAPRSKPLCVCFAGMKASPWEKEGAIREGVEIVNFLAPKAFTHDSARLTGVVFKKMAAKRDERGRRILAPTGEPDVPIKRDDY